jgi:hypothetical protein
MSYQHVGEKCHKSNTCILSNWHAGNCLPSDTDVVIELGDVRVMKLNYQPRSAASVIINPPKLPAPPPEDAGIGATFRLEEQWEQQKEFIKLLQERRGFPSIPIDITSKQGQKFLKDLTHDCMHELFEANICLKNAKSHRQTEIVEFGREAYIEELVDVLHYLYEIAIYSGVTLDELHDAYIAKGKTNVERITGGY